MTERSYATGFLERQGRGRPPLILEGWVDECECDDPKRPNPKCVGPHAGTWKTDTPAGRLVAAVRQGSHLAAAAAYARISEAALHKWLARGRDARPDDEFDRLDVEESERPYVDLIEAVVAAAGALEVELVAVWKKAAGDNWQAAERFLAKRFRERWRDEKYVAADISLQEQDEVRGLLEANPAVALAAEELALQIEIAQRQLTPEQPRRQVPIEADEAEVIDA